MAILRNRICSNHCLSGSCLIVLAALQHLHLLNLERVGDLIVLVIGHPVLITPAHWSLHPDNAFSLVKQDRLRTFLIIFDESELQFDGKRGFRSTIDQFTN